MLIVLKKISTTITQLILLPLFLQHHAKVSFSEEDKCYSLVDLGSRNGTYVDGKRISVALRESEPVPLHHGTMMKVGCTRLECHVHAGRDTCPQCEPGCAQPSKSLGGL